MKQNVIDAYNLKFKHLIDQIKKTLEEFGKEPASDIRIYIDYPMGWYAVVGIMGIDDKPYVFIFKEYNGKKQLIIEECLGVQKNGSLMYADLEY